MLHSGRSWFCKHTNTSQRDISARFCIVCWKQKEGRNQLSGFHQGDFSDERTFELGFLRSRKSLHGETDQELHYPCTFMTRDWLENRDGGKVVRERLGNNLRQRSWTFLALRTNFVEDNFSMDWGWGGDVSGMIQVYYIYWALYFYCYYIVIYNE